jgi:hypothetical protein
MGRITDIERPRSVWVSLVERIRGDSGKAFWNVRVNLKKQRENDVEFVAASYAAEEYWKQEEILAEKDKEIAELKDLLRKDHERECVASLLHESESKLARALGCLERIAAIRDWRCDQAVGIASEAIAEISATPVLADKPAEKCDYCGNPIPCLNRCHVDMDPSK